MSSAALWDVYYWMTNDCKAFHKKRLPFLKFYSAFRKSSDIFSFHPDWYGNKLFEAIAWSAVTTVDLHSHWSHFQTWQLFYWLVNEICIFLLIQNVLQITVFPVCTTQNVFWPQEEMLKYVKEEVWILFECAKYDVCTNEHPAAILFNTTRSEISPKPFFNIIFIIFLFSPFHS